MNERSRPCPEPVDIGAEALMAVRPERPHAEFVGQGESLPVVYSGLVSPFAQAPPGNGSLPFLGKEESCPTREP